MMSSRFIQWKRTNPDSYTEMKRKRKQRYELDEEFRHRQLRYNANWRKKRKKKRSNRRMPAPKFFDFNGVAVEFWGIGRTVEFLGIDKKTITNLENNGSVPVNHYKSTNRRRWWPADFVRWLKPYFEARKCGISAQEFHRRVWIGWSEEQVRNKIPVIQSGLLCEENTDNDHKSEEQGS